MIVPQPVSFQINWNTIIHLKIDGSDSRLIVANPPSFDPSRRLFFVTARETCATYFAYDQKFEIGVSWMGGGTVLLEAVEAVGGSIYRAHGLGSRRVIDDDVELVRLLAQLFTREGIEEHATGLDHFLDEVEVLLDELTRQYGLETSLNI